MRVPCIMRWPGHISAGATCGAVATAMDFLPTLAALAGRNIPLDRVIDGKNILSLMQDPNSASPHEVFYYYRADELQAVRAGDWKLHLMSGALYNLRTDVGETRDVAADNPGVVERLERRAAQARDDIGDSVQGVTGKNLRPCGRTAHPKPLTEYDPEHPYVVAMYD